MVRVLCAGHVNWDVTLQVDALPEPDGEARIVSQQRSGGGSAANVAVSLAGLDVSVGLLGSVGNDDHGAMLRDALGDRGVDLGGLVTIPDARTSIKYLIVDQAGEVMVLGNDGANEAISPDVLDPDRVHGVGHVHLTGQRPQTAAALARMAREAGATVSFDPGRRLADRDYGPTLSVADVILLNDREAAAGLAADSAAGDDATIVVKHGAAGAEVRWDGQRVTHGGFDVDPVDTTGAGDAFAAGFIAARLEGVDPPSALAFANACGALATAEPGAWTAPNRDAVEGLLGRGTESHRASERTS